MAGTTVEYDRGKGVNYPSYVETRNTSNVNRTPLPFKDVYEDISSELSKQPNLQLVKNEIEKVIRRINDEIGLWKAIIDVTPGTSTTTIDADTSTWDGSTVNVNKSGRFREEFVWDSDNKMLRLEDFVVELLTVYVDDEEWEQTSFDAVRDSANTSEKIFHQVGKFLYFPVDFASNAKVLKIHVKQMFGGVEQLEGFGIETAVINLPHHYRQLLISGVIMTLTVRQQFKDLDLHKYNKEVFNAEYLALRKNYENLEQSYINFGLTYQY